MAENDPKVSAEIPRGAIVTTAYASRVVKAIAILESEVEQISMFNTLATAFVAAGTALFSAAVGIWADGKFAEKLTPQGDILASFAVPALCVAGAFFYLLAVWIYRTRKSILNIIRSESKTEPPPS